MALKVWLPLNGNLENKGISGITGTTGSATTINNNGKIGKCYNFTGTTNDYIDLSESISLSTVSGYSFTA